MRLAYKKPGLTSQRENMPKTWPEQTVLDYTAAAPKWRRKLSALDSTNNGIRFSYREVSVSDWLPREGDGAPKSRGNQVELCAAHFALHDKLATAASITTTKATSTYAAYTVTLP